MATPGGRWHGKTRYFGLHYDLHAGPSDTELGVRAGPKYLVPLLEIINPDFVQTDCKGHPGYTSWYSKVPNASVSPGVKRDALKGWRAATRQLDLPLHCHYSGIWDAAAGARHPEWGAITAAGLPAGAAFGPGADEPGPPQRMCPRGPYLERLLVPQMMELIDRYGVDGFWVDGDIWAVEPCYCQRCTSAFKDATGIAAPPREESDPSWAAWWWFTMEGFEHYVTRYCEHIHERRPHVLICSNWLQTFRHPGEPRVPTDWISGDNTPSFGLDAGRCEARFISTRGKPWDIMIWSFYSGHGMGDRTSPWTFKPAEMIQQEAAVVCALGGNVQVYENPGGLRDGRLVEWRARRLRQVSRFVKARRSLCQGSETIPQVVVLHSEHHARSRPGPNLMRGIDPRPVQGATWSLLESHYGVDIMDEWALLPRLDSFPAVVAPEQDRMSDEMIAALVGYVEAGGKLLVSGPAAYQRFGSRFLGVRKGVMETESTYHVPAADGSFAAWSGTWHLTRASTATPLGQLATSPLLEDRLLPQAAAFVNKVGRGAVAYVPFEVFRFFEHNRYPLTRAYVGEVVRSLVGKLAISVSAPTCIDVVLRAKGTRSIVHLINRASGVPQRPNDSTVDEIPPMGPIEVEMKLARRPKGVRVALERAPLEWKFRAGKRTGTLTARLEKVHVHAALVVEL
ncbi:alpha-L-fucosidase [Candidatus Latescibacterota bacterium]